MQKTILLYLEQLRTPFSAQITEILTITAEVSFVVIAIAVVLWSIDKKKGIQLAVSVLFSVIIGFVVKAIVRYPRPFTVISSLHPLRISTATGYSFPSGHSLNATALWVSLCLLFRKKWLYIVSALLITCVGLSRLVLGVHWPVDVAGGIIMGTLLPSIIITALRKAEGQAAGYEKLETISGTVLLTTGVVLEVLLECGADSTAFTDLMKLSLFGGTALLGFSAEQKHIGFSADGSTGRKILRCLLGILGLAVISAGIKAAFGQASIVAAVRYLLCGLWVSVIYPLLGSRTGLFSCGLYHL